MLSNVPSANRCLRRGLDFDSIDLVGFSMVPVNVDVQPPNVVLIVNRIWSPNDGSSGVSLIRWFSLFL